MRIPVLLRNVLVALIALLSVGLQSAHADVGGITLVVYKGGWFIGGSAGHGTLNFYGQLKSGQLTGRYTAVQPGGVALQAGTFTFHRESSQSLPDTFDVHNCPGDDEVHSRYR